MKEKLRLKWRCNDQVIDIGELICEDSRYYFYYIEDGVRKALNYGFEPLKGFPRISSKYFSEEPFKLFRSWIPGNVDIDSITTDSFRGLSHDNFLFEDPFNDFVETEEPNE